MWQRRIVSGGIRNPGRDERKLVVRMKVSRERRRFADCENSREGGYRRFKAAYSMRTEILYASRGKFRVRGAESRRLASPRMKNSNLKAEGFRRKGGPFKYLMQTWPLKIRVLSTHARACAREDAHGVTLARDKRFNFGKMFKLGWSGGALESLEISIRHSARRDFSRARDDKIAGRLRSRKERKM